MADGTPAAGATDGATHRQPIRVIFAALMLVMFLASLDQTIASTALPDAKFAPDSPLEGTGFELPVRGRGQFGCRPFYAAECSRRVGAPSQFSDSTTPCILIAPGRKRQRSTG